MLRIERYQKESLAVWNSFVRTARNATFLFERGYMDYHSDRFTDHSLMLSDDGGRLLALLPANERDGVLYSHQGLTYGGLLLHPRAGLADVGEMFRLLTEYMREHSFHELSYKFVPPIYHRQPAEEDVYWLSRLGGQYSISEEKSVMTAIPLSAGLRLPVAATKRNYARRLQREGCRLNLNASVSDFWPVLESNLMATHGVKPVHTLAEMQLLQARFPENIVCHTVTDAAGRTLCGTVIYLTPLVVHTQYISASAEGKRLHALDYLFCELTERYAQSADGYRFLDFGSSMEPSTGEPNLSLVKWKEMWGGRTVVVSKVRLLLR